MDALTADIAAKLIIQDDPVNAADIERLKQDEELNVREDKEKVVRALKEGAEAKAAAAKPSKIPSPSSASSPCLTTLMGEAESPKPESSFNISNEEDEAELGSGGVLDLGLVKSDPDKLYPIIYYALKRTLKEWEEAMDERPEDIKRTTQGQLAAATQVQSAEYLKPLFKALRSRSLPADVLARIAEIVHYMQKRQYQRANHSHLRLSIGNAPWPLGITMVGIHEQSAREEISSDSVAHVLNDEVSRNYIQSLKRLLTFSQTKYPPEDVSN